MGNQPIDGDADSRKQEIHQLISANFDSSIPHKHNDSLYIIEVYISGMQVS
jgi:hypothetical protein